MTSERIKVIWEYGETGEVVVLYNNEDEKEQPGKQGTTSEDLYSPAPLHPAPYLHLHATHEYINIL